MIFVVAIDPESVQTLIDKGELGEDQLLGIFESLLQNCLLAETSTWRVGPALRETARKVKDPDIKKKIWSILEIFGNPEKNRFVDVISGYNADYDTCISEIIVHQAGNAELDAAICEKKQQDGVVEFISALRFNSSNFARDRSRSACALIYAPGKRANDLLREAFGRLVRHADIIPFGFDTPKLASALMERKMGHGEPLYPQAAQCFCADVSLGLCREVSEGGYE